MFKRMKRLLRLRNKSGFTLVEVIISCALLGVLILGVMGFITPVLTSVRAKEQNARATMLSEAICTYIANSTQYAFYVQTLSEVVSNDTRSISGASPAVLSLQYSGSEFEKQKDKGLNDLLTCMKNDLAGEVYEIRCIGVRWLDVPGGNGMKKLMVTNEKVNQDNCSLEADKAVPVFEAVYYDGLYPIIKFENYSNQYQLKDDDGNLQDKVEADKVDIAAGLRIVTDIYLTPDCYAVKENVRNNALPTLTGSTYADFTNIRSNLTNKGIYKIHPTISAHTASVSGEIVPSYAAAYSARSTGEAYNDIDGKEYYYPNSFIYYIVRKTKTGSDPSTPAPAGSGSEPTT